MIILASQSKTRADILKNFKVTFKQKSVDFDEESLVKIYRSPRSFVYHATKGKLDLAIKKFGLDNPILVADTVVSVKDNILRKAKDEKEALDILKLQSNNQVDIYTCTIYKSKNMEFLDLSVTSYIFDRFDEKDLIEYIESKEWIGKAGACMVEGFCKKYIKSVKGFESTAKGLSIEKVLPFIRVDESLDV